MTRFHDLQARARTWWHDQPARLQRDLDDLAASGMDLAWSATDSGLLTGRLPIWPFARPAPAGLKELFDGQGLAVEVTFGHGYPMVCPGVRPVDPSPPLARWTQHKWHVNGNGTLCLLQSADAWDPLTPLSDVLRKSASWRVEYALLEAGVIDTMTLRGIVDNDELDHLVAEAAHSRSKADAPDDGEAA